MESPPVKFHIVVFGSQRLSILDTGSMHVSVTFAFQVPNCPFAVEDAGNNRPTLFGEGYGPVPCVTLFEVPIWHLKFITS